MRSIAVVVIALLCGWLGPVASAVAQYQPVRLPPVPSEPAGSPGGAHPFHGLAGQPPRAQTISAPPTDTYGPGGVPVLRRLPAIPLSDGPGYPPGVSGQGDPSGTEWQYGTGSTATGPGECSRLVCPTEDVPGDPAADYRDFPDGEEEADWWDEPVTGLMLDSRYALPVTLDSLVLSAVRYSPRVRAISDIPLVQETEIEAAAARFDYTAFWETKFDDISEPVGNVLTTGGSPRLRDDIWDLSAGIRRKVDSGGTIELSQQFGYHQSNSRFFLPEQQGNARLSLSFSQPLLNGAGKPYNRGQIVLAEINTDIAWDQLAVQLQDHLLEVVRGYWRLYLERAVYAQKQRHLKRAERILEHLQARRGVDALESQILKARAAVTAREAELQRARTAIRNAESRIRALVGDPGLQTEIGGELVPRELPTTPLVDIPLTDALYVALQHRPEIDEAARRVRAAQVRLDLACNELLPVLNVVLDAYVAGLEGAGDMAQAIGDQFTVGEPGYTLGLVGEVPLGNRAANARQRRRQLEVRQLANDLEATTDVLLAEVEVAVREVHTSACEADSARAAMKAAQSEVAYLDERWQMLPGDDQAASFLLQDLLDAQDRLAETERAVVAAQVNYALAHCQLKRGMGTLLDCEQILVHRECDGCTPRLILEKTGPSCRVGPGGTQR